MMKIAKSYFLDSAFKAAIQSPFFTFLLGSAAILLLLYSFIPLPSPLFKQDYSKVVLDSKGKILRVFLNGNDHWYFPPNEEIPIPEKLKKTVLFFEDKYFYRHRGVNPVALGRALMQNLRKGEVVSGASTITMQVARLMRPKSRTYFNKLVEILQSLKIEVRYSKEEILRFYLDNAPYGSNIIGYQAASRRYFQKLPEQLTWSEAATLAVLPNAPGLISPVANKLQLEQKRNRLLKSLFDARIIDVETYRLSLLERIPETSKPFAMAAPHLTRLLAEKYPQESIIKTTIDTELQIKASDLVKRQVTFLQNLGIQNGAALVVNTQTGEVKAYVGSQDFFDQGNHGQVDGVPAPRSSGSLLKPFLYALCMDEGILLPQTKIKDVPSFYGAFSPANASMKYDGIVAAEDALVRSLNVPAARLLYTYGVQPFYLFLENAGMTTLFRSAEDYGLPLILGGAEATVWDMASLFRGLANAGRFLPLSILPDDKESHVKTSRLISAGACYLTLNMLRNLKRPGAEFYWQQYQNQWPLAWKTGTSYGQRDAWAVGVNPEWTIVAWVGNFSGEGNANLTGASCAGPLLFDIFNMLPKDPLKSWFESPSDDLELIETCAETGYLAGPNCPRTTMVEAPRFMKALKVCPYHQTIFVSEDEKYEVCSRCWETGKYKKMTYLVFPPDVAQYLQEQGQVINKIPPHKPDCPAVKSVLALQIVYPQQNARLWVPRDFDKSLQEVTMKVAHRNKDNKLFWYLDDHYIGSSLRQPTMALKLGKGWHELEVIDQTGNRDKKKFFVEMKGE